MHEHGPDELPGPVRGTRAWWQGLAASEQQAAEGPPTDEPQPKKRRKPNKEGAPIRTELVDRIRKEIAAGTYDTHEKWEAALDRMLDHMQND